MFRTINPRSPHRYIHQRLQQCPMQERLTGHAEKLAEAAGKPVAAVKPLEVRCPSAVRVRISLDTWAVRVPQSFGLWPRTYQL